MNQSRELNANHGRASILIAEDDPKQVRLYARIFADCRLTFVNTGRAALEALAEATPHVIILDHTLAGGELGTEILPQLKARAAHVPVVIISGTLGIEDQFTALSGPLSASYVLRKPVDLEALESTVEKAIVECGFGETVKMLRSIEAAERENASDPERRFTERLARQHEILKRLRHSLERANLSALARDFNVHRRTIQLDLQDLVRRGQLPEAVYPEWSQAVE